MNKFVKIGIPILIGGAGIFLIAKNYLFPKKDKTTPPQPNNPSSSTKTTADTFVSGTTTVTDAFPLKIGSKGANVTKLQNALGIENLGGSSIDGVFGAKTEAAVVKFLNKKTVDSAADITRIASLKATTDLEHKKNQAGAKLIAQYKADPYLMIMPLVNTVATQVQIDANNYWIFTSNKFTMQKGLKYNHSDYVLKEVSGMGNLLMEKRETTSKKLMGYYVINPLDITLVKGSTLSFTGNNADAIIWP